MQEKIKPTPTADKMLSIIASRFHLRKSLIEPGTTWPQLGLTGPGKAAMLAELAERFFIAPPADPVAILTVWDALKWVESAECYNREGYYGR